MVNKELSKYLAKIGSKGGKAAAAAMTKDQRVARARKASRVRAAKRMENATMEKITILDRIEAMAETWLTAAEASKYLKTEPRALLRLVREGKVQGYKLSGTKRHVYRFLERDLDAALMGQAVTQ
jgi:excisionase family DNA binding protein